MAYDVNNLTPESRKKIMIVLKDILIKSELCDRKRFLLFKIGNINGVSKGEHENIILGLIKDETTKETRWVSFVFPSHYLLRVDEKFFAFYNDVENSLKAKEKTKDKTENKVIKILGINENTKWEDITIEFKNEYDVKIKAKGKSFDSDYEKMGFADKRKNTKQDTKAKESWKLLQNFSTNNNIFPLATLAPREKEKRLKNKQELSKLLKTYFGINDDPILYDEDKGEYRIKIQTIPEADFRDQWADRNIYEENSP